MRLECVTDSLLDSFKLLSSLSGGMQDILKSYSDKYTQSMQKFSVLAYDYLERINIISERE